MSDKLYELMDWPEIEAVVYSEEYAPREILGPHVTGDGVLIQCFFPGADKVTVKTTKDGREYPMSKEDDAGYFAVLLSGRKIPEYTYLVEPSIAMSGIYRTSQRIKSRKGRISRIEKTEKGFYLLVDIDE